MKRTLTICGCAALAVCACTPEEKPLVEIPAPVTASVMAGVPASVTIAGTGFQETDSLFLAWADGSEAIESYEITDSQIKLGIDAYSGAKGKTATVNIWRDGRSQVISGDITVTAPELKDGFISQKALLDALWQHNGDVRAMIGECRLIDIDAAGALVQDTQCDNEWGILAIDGNGASDWSDLVIFKSLGKGLKTMEDQEYKNFICWGAGEITEIDFSNWDAYIQVRASSCPKLEKVILGPNMKGGDFDNSPVKYFDMHLASGADWVMNLKNLEYADLTRTYIEGGQYNVDFNHWRGSGNVKNITFADNAEIHIDSEVFSHAWTGGGVRDSIVDAWKKGAKVVVHDIFDYDKVTNVKSYAEDPHAMDAE